MAFELPRTLRIAALSVPRVSAGFAKCLFMALSVVRCHAQRLVAIGGGADMDDRSAMDDSDANDPKRLHPHRHSPSFFARMMRSPLGYILSSPCILGSSAMTTKVAVIQKPPVLLNRSGTIDAVLASIDEAVGEGASLLVFPEAYIPGYPTWIWRLRPGG